MAPTTQRKIDFPVRKTRSSQKTKLVNEENAVTDKVISVKEENERLIQKTPTKRLQVYGHTTSCCSPPKRSKENISQEQRQSPKKAKNRLKFSEPSEDKIKASPYRDAKHVLHTACPERILGREKEIQYLSTFLDNHLSEKKSGSLYVSGPPGTGKTACLTHLLKALTVKMKFKPVFINCMTLKKSQDIFKKIASELGNDSVRCGKECLKFLEKSFAASGPMILLILDEIDHLDSKNQEVLYSIYEWSKLKSSRLILIGVANALDLTDRVLPRLKACNITPKLLNYAPYTKDQIQTILQDRLGQVKKDNEIVFKPMAVQFCARKIAACAGDIRKALDVCRRAIELVEADMKKPILKSSNSQESVKLKQVDVPHVASVLKSVYESRIVASDQSFSETFPMQQKILIGTLLLIAKKGKSKEITIGKLHEVYCRVCKKQQISEISQSEFDSMCSMIDSRGIVAIKQHKERRLSKITMKIDENEVEHVLQDQRLIAAILDDDTCLKR